MSYLRGKRWRNDINQESFEDQVLDCEVYIIYDGKVQEVRNGEYVPVQNCRDHYITVTGIREYDGTDGEHQIMLEISTWGKKYYMDYDDYKAFIELQKEDSGFLNHMWENAYNNILYIKEEKINEHKTTNNGSYTMSVLSHR